MKVRLFFCLMVFALGGFSVLKSFANSAEGCAQNCSNDCGIEISGFDPSSGDCTCFSSVTITESCDPNAAANTDGACPFPDDTVGD